MKIFVKLADGTWKEIDETSQLVSRRASNNTWFNFNPNDRQIISKKVDKAWEDQVPKVRYR